jgi:ribosome biogenesis protein SSF1/2
MPRKRGGRQRGKTKSQMDTTEADKAIPKSIIVYRGEVGTAVRYLMHEWRRVFMPWVSAKLHGRNNSLRDFLGIASSFSASHLQIFTAPPRGTWLRIMRFPAGPTLSFRVESFALRSDIVANQKKPPPVDGAPYNTAPVVVLNNFAGSTSSTVGLMGQLFQSLFPTININLIKPGDVHRVVLFQYDAEADVVEVRHYFVIGKAVGLSRTVKKLFEGRVPTKLNQLEDIDDVLDKEAVWSDTDGEGEEVPLAAPFRSLQGRCRVKLSEIGPRMTLKLVKIEAGFAGGETIFHDTVVKSREEAAANASKVRGRQLQKAARRAEQDENVRRKQERLEERRARKKRRVQDSDDDEDGDADDDDEGKRRRRSNAVEEVSRNFGDDHDN